MKDRCTNPAAVSAEHYHDKGIGFCERWSSFDAFFSDMGAMPDGASLDRIDNSKGYEPGNCRWATRKTQAQNRSVTRWVTAYGRTLCLADWATLSGCKYGTLYKRIVVLGQHPEAAISERAGRSWEIEEVGRSADPLPSDGIPALGGDA